MAQLQGLRILVVDDNDDTRDFMTLFLEAEGAEVAVAATAAGTMEAFGRSRPDVFVCDIGLPDGDGCSLLRTIRGLPKELGGDVPAVALTGYSYGEIEERIVEAGFDVHLVKPIEPRTLADVVANVAGRSGDPAR